MLQTYRFYISTDIADYNILSSLMRKKSCPIQTASQMPKSNTVEIESIEDFNSTIKYIQQNKRKNKIQIQEINN